MGLTQRLRKLLLLALTVALLGALCPPVATAQEDDGEERDHAGNCSQVFSDTFGNGDLSLDTLTSAGECAGNLMSGGRAPAEIAATSADTQAAVKEEVSGVFGKVVGWLGSGALRAIMWTMTFWLDKPSTIVLNAAGDQVDNEGNVSDASGDDRGLVFRVMDYTGWLQLLFGMLSILAVAVRFAMTRWSEAEDNIQDFFMMLGRIVLTTAIWVPLIILLTRMTDAFSSWVIEESSASASEDMKVFLENKDWGEDWGPAQAWSNNVGMQGTSALVLLGSIISVITSLIQIVFSFLREGMLVVLCAVVPMVAYASALETGREAWGKVKGWTIALLLFTPAASLVYAIAFLSVGDIGEEDSIGVLGVLVLFGMAVLVLPSLISLVAPAAGMAPAGGSGMRVAGALGAAAVAGGMAGAAGASGAFGGGSKAAASAAPTGKAGLASSQGGNDGGSEGGTGGSEGGGDGPTPSPTGGPPGSGGAGGAGEGDSSGGSPSPGGTGGEGTGGDSAGAGGDGGSQADPAPDPGGDGGAGTPPPDPGAGGDSASPGGSEGESGGKHAAAPAGGSPGGQGGSGGPSESGSPSGSGFNHGAAAKAAGASAAASASGQQQPDPHRFAGPGAGGRGAGRGGPPPVDRLRQAPSTPPSGVPR